MSSVSLDLCDSFAKLSLERIAEACGEHDSDYPTRAQLRKDFAQHRLSGEPALSSILNSNSEQSKNLEIIISEELQPKLRQAFNGSFIEKDHEFFLHSKIFCRKWGLPNRNLENYTKLLCGNLLFPVLLLQNPCKLHDEDYDTMMTSPTFSWLRIRIEAAGLTLEDLVVVDVFPLLDDRRLQTMTETNKLTALREAFDLTLKFFEVFRPSIVISCQCATRNSEDPDARSLCSSVKGARTMGVEQRCISQVSIHLVKGFHPCYILRHGDQIEAEDRSQVLEKILRTAYDPCGRWQARWEEDRRAAQTLVSAKERVKEEFDFFLKLVQSYKEAEENARLRGICLKERRPEVDKELAKFLESLL